MNGTGDIPRAMAFAVEAHEGQLDWGGNPFIGHPLRVAAYASQMFGRLFGTDETIVVAAILHDVVEDTHYEVNDIQYMFGDDVAKLVDYMSRRSEETYREYIDRLLLGPELALYIKLADLKDNMDPYRVPFTQAQKHAGMVKDRYEKSKSEIEEELRRRG